MNNNDIFLFIHFKGTSWSQICAVPLTKQRLHIYTSTAMSLVIIWLHGFTVGKLYFYENILFYIG